MFSKEYTFETKSTRLRRLKNNLLIVIFLSVLFFSFFCLYVPIYSKSATLSSNEYFYQKSPDLVAVFTGGQGRIQKGIKYAQKYPNTKFLISGVYVKNSFQTIVNTQTGEPLEASKIMSEQAHQMEIDYQSRNTLENVISTLHYLRNDSSLSEVLIISSDYHLFRIEMLISSLLKEQDKDIKFHFYGVSTDFSKFRNIKILIYETIKIIRTRIFLLFWEH